MRFHRFAGILLFALASTGIISCSKCFHVICDACDPMQYKSNVLVRFSVTDGQYTGAELDTIFVQCIKTASQDTTNVLLIQNANSFDNITVGEMQSLNSDPAGDYKFQLMLKDSSKIISMEKLTLRYEPEDEDACCDCNKYVYEKVTIDGNVYTSGQVFEVMK